MNVADFAERLFVAGVHATGRARHYMEKDEPKAAAALLTAAAHAFEACIKYVPGVSVDEHGKGVDRQTHG